jgi:hypothetical protein
VRAPAGGGVVSELIETFATTTYNLLVLHDGVKAHDITHVAMVCTGVYW